MTVPRCTACLPGRRRIALTTGALACLDNGQVDAVLAHERAHLSELHHLILALAVALEHAFPAIRFFAVAARQITYLTEVAADDAAARRALRLTLAAALLAAVAVGVLARGPRRGRQVPQRSASAASSTPAAGQHGTPGRHLRGASHDGGPGHHRARSRSRHHLRCPAAPYAW